MHRLKKGQVAYFDYAATTPTDPRVLEAMLPYFGPDGVFGNPSSVQHGFGTAAAEAVEIARKRIALVAGVKPSEVIWTSGATEANNLALRGVLGSEAKKPRKLITVATEHLSILDTAKALRKEGFALEVLPVRRNGLIDLDRLETLVRSTKSLVSVMWVNNETGVIQPIDKIASICRAAGAIIHVDAAQAMGKTSINIKKIPVDLMSLSAHKVYGPKGVGALVVRRGITLKPLASGGAQERGIRPGTLPTPLIAGMGKAFEISAKEDNKQVKQIDAWHKHTSKFINELDDAKLNGDSKNKVPHILNASFGGISTSLLSSLPKLALSNSSACTTQKTTASHVLMAMGLSKFQALNSLRISFGRFTTDDQVNQMIAEIGNIVSNIRRAKKTGLD